MITSSNRNIFRVTALCAGNSLVTSEFPSQRPVTQSFDVCFHLCLNKRFSKQSWGWWFETPLRSLWRHCNGICGSSGMVCGVSVKWTEINGVCVEVPLMGLLSNYLGHFRIAQHIRCIFMNENLCILIIISLKFVPKGPIDNKPALVQVMAWRQTGDKPLPEPMLTQFTDVHMQH